jgi:hypothetical protein
MHLDQETIDKQKVTNPTDPAQNIDAGVAKAAELYQQFHGNVPMVLAADKFGATNPSQWSTPEARAYVANVYKNMDKEIPLSYGALQDRLRDDSYGAIADMANESTESLAVLGKAGLLAALTPNDTYHQELDLLRAQQAEYNAHVGWAQKIGTGLVGFAGPGMVLGKGLGAAAKAAEAGPEVLQGVAKGLKWLSGGGEAPEAPTPGALPQIVPKIVQGASNVSRGATTGAIQNLIGANVDPVESTGMQTAEGGLTGAGLSALSGALGPWAKPIAKGLYDYTTEGGKGGWIKQAQQEIGKMIPKGTVPKTSSIVDRTLPEQLKGENPKVNSEFKRVAKGKEEALLRQTQNKQKMLERFHQIIGTSKLREVLKAKLADLGDQDQTAQGGPDLDISDVYAAVQYALKNSANAKIEDFSNRLNRVRKAMLRPKKKGPAPTGMPIQMQGRGAAAFNAAQELLDLGKSTGVEHMRIYDPNLDESPSAYNARGNGHSVRMSPKAIIDSADKNHSLVLQHNHPSSHATLTNNFVEDLSSPTNQNFKNWFGDSKVVNKDGQPLVVYHGTNKTQNGEAFHIFDTYASNYGLMGQGAYFTENPEVASSYTKKGTGSSPSVYPVYLSIKNPIDMDADANVEEWKKAFPDIELYHENGTSNEDWMRAAEESLVDQDLPKWEGAEAMQDGLRSMGYDGITHIGGGRVKTDSINHRVWIAFDPEQIKSAIGNTGEFNPRNPDLLAAPPGPHPVTSAGWYGPLSTADFGVATNDGISWVVAHGHNGTISAVRLPDGIGNKFYRVKKDTENYMEQWVKQFGLNARDSWLLKHDLGNTLAAEKLGGRYISSFPIHPAALPKFQKLLDQELGALPDDAQTMGRFDRLTARYSPDEGLGRVLADARGIARDKLNQRVSAAGSQGGTPLSQKDLAAQQVLAPTAHEIAHGWIEPTATPPVGGGPRPKKLETDYYKIYQVWKMVRHELDAKDAVKGIDSKTRDELLNIKNALQAKLNTWRPFEKYNEDYSNFKGQLEAYDFLHSKSMTNATDTELSTGKLKNLITALESAPDRPGILGDANRAKRVTDFKIKQLKQLYDEMVIADKAKPKGDETIAPKKSFLSHVVGQAARHALSGASAVAGYKLAQEAGINATAGGIGAGAGTEGLFYMGSHIAQSNKQKLDDAILHAMLYPQKYPPLPTAPTKTGPGFYAGAIGAPAVTSYVYPSRSSK